MKALLIHVFTGPDNSTFDGARVMGGVGFLWFLVMGTFDVTWRGHAFDWTTVSGSLSALIVAICGAVRVKASTEPPPS